LARDLKSHHVKNTHATPREIIPSQYISFAIKFQGGIMQHKNNGLRCATVISTLLNPMHFFIHRVYIAREKGNFRLIVFHRGRLLTDEYYRSACEAKIAFLKKWGHRAVHVGVYPIWSHFYPPGKSWLNVWYSSITQRRFISLLVNSQYYFIETAFIMIEKEGYRLVVIHRGVLLSDDICETVEEAKQRFMELHGCKVLKDNIKTEWSFFYPLDPDWLDDKLKTVELAEASHGTAEKWHDGKLFHR
jgi:hypothetical protein